MNMEKPMMTAIELKAAALFYMLYRLHFFMAVTEYGGKGCEGIADLFGINAAGFSHEFEVKVAKADLAGELRTIRWLLDRDEKKNCTYAKLDKHCKYFGVAPPGDQRQWWSDGRPPHVEVIPNKFSFCVPPELAKYAFDELKGTRYGLVVITGSYDFETKKKAEYLHKEKPTQETIMKLAHKSSTEIQSLRHDLVVAQKNYAALRKQLPTP